jgi:hypothetical protein
LSNYVEFKTQFVIGLAIRKSIQSDFPEIQLSKPIIPLKVMPLTELFPVVSQLSHQDKLRLIHFLLLAVAKEEGYELQATETQTQENLLLKQLEATEAVVWSPYDAHGAAQTLSELLVAARQEGNA